MITLFIHEFNKTIHSLILDITILYNNNDCAVHKKVNYLFNNIKNQNQKIK